MSPRLLVLVALLATACRSTADSRQGAPRPSATATAAGAPTAPLPRVLHDLVRAFPACDVSHRGLLFDVGTDSMIGRYGWTRGLPAGVTRVEHDGSTWGRFIDRRFRLSFTMLSPAQIFVASRAVGYGAKGVAVALDDQPLGTMTFQREHIKIAQTVTTTLAVDPGLHTLTFRFTGRVRDGDAFADIDWIRVGVPDDNAAAFSPPTLRDTLAPGAALTGVPHRSIALRAPSGVRCALRFPRGGRLRAAVGIQGIGEGEAEIRVLRDGKRADLLRAVHLTGGDKAGWIDLDLPLDPFAGVVGAIELAATQAPPGGRVLFGDPAVVLPPVAVTPSPPARAVVIVVLDGVTRAELPPWSGATGAALPALADLAKNGAVFEQHRAPSTVVAATVASLLTGLPPSSHSVTDAGARLSASIPTIAGIARDASLRAAMFTGVPYTFRAFGFGASWERFIERSPASGAPATAPIDDATAWTSELVKASRSDRMLVVVHARGGHPPWDVTAKELSTAAPPDYTGMIEPRTSAQKIGKMRRARHSVITDADRQRIRALGALGLAGQDRALGALIAAFKASGLWDTTLFMVTGDVSSGEGDLFADGLDLKEPALTLPLYVHFPGGIGAGQRIAEPTEMVDLTRTALAALGLPPQREETGRDLSRIAEGLDVGSLGPQVSALDHRYSARWGDLVLSGKYPQPPALCDLSLDATCAFNRREAMPIAAGAIFRGVVAKDLAISAAAKREPASIDADTAAALSVWGATE